MDQRILQLLKEARQQLELDRQRRTAPIAIVGIGCRFPGGVTDLASLWDLLHAGRDATTTVPADRWNVDDVYDPDPDAPGKAYTERGAFLDQIDAFDAKFFGIPPNEAARMDPQQRLLLEVTWEALEDAGIPAERLRGSATGVWVGMCTADYIGRSLLSGDPDNIDAYSTLGNMSSVAVGRISYVLDLRGPNVQVDTACSSSLVALHQACQSLRAGETDVGLVGGVNLMSAPEMTIALCKLRALAKDGRCKTFDASADGYGRGEGCGMLVLKRLSDAIAAGDRIHALIRGSAVNHDGHSNGLTAPNGLSQEAVIRAALANAEVAPADVAYAEAHGTGTLLGDPIEVLALSRVYGMGRSAASPLMLGAIKANIGHLEAAAGVAGVIKVASCLAKRAFPPQQIREGNPKIPWLELPVLVVQQPTPWPRHDRARLAGVSAFGLSGTNAHVILEEAPETAAEQAPGLVRASELILLSAKTPEALNAVARRLREHLEQRPETRLVDVAYSLVNTRSLLEHRLAVTAPTLEALKASLSAVESGEPHPEIVRSQPTERQGKLAWLFTGQGAQRAGMGQGLYREWSAFRDALDEACGLIDPLLGRSLKSVMWAESGSAASELLDQTAFTQPALFAYEWALSQLWDSFGIEPEVLLGHSIGEITAACYAGVLSLADAARLVCARGRLMQALPTGGAMISIAAPEAEVVAAVAALPKTVSVAAINAPASIVISGVEGDVALIAQRFHARGTATKRLSVSHAFHSPLMDKMLGDFRHVAESIDYRKPRLAFVSNVSGRLAGDEVARAEYWVRHVREAVRFSGGVKALYAAGARTFMELGPRATLLGLVPASSASDVTLLPSQAAGRSEAQAVLDALGGWVVQGGSVDWSGVFPEKGRRVSLPSYPWERQRHWLTPSANNGGPAGERTLHPLLGTRLAIAGTDVVYDTLLSINAPSWVNDHRVGGRAVVPATALLELVRAAGEEQAPGAQRQVKALSFQAPLVVLDGRPRRVQVILSEHGTRASVYGQTALAGAATEWTLHATAELVDAAAAGAPQLDLDALRERCVDELDVADVYAGFDGLLLRYGPVFRGLRALRRGSGEALAEIELGGDRENAERYGVHPALLDAAFQAVVAVIGARQEAFLPFEIGRLIVHSPGRDRALVHVRRVSAPSGAGVTVDLVLADRTGVVIAEVHELQLRRADPRALARQDSTSRSNPESRGAFYRLHWESAAPPGTATLAGRWLILSELNDPRAQALVAALQAEGVHAEGGSLTEAIDTGAAQNVVCLFSVASNGAAAATRAAQQGLAVLQAIARQTPALRVWWVTEAGVSTRGEDVTPSLSAVWGLGRAVMAEYPELRCTLVDLERGSPSVPSLMRELGSRDEESQVAWRDGQRHVARLERAPAIVEASDGSPRRDARKEGTVVISGGLNGLGLEVARSFARRGTRHLLLISRRGLAFPGASEAKAELEALGSHVSVAAADVRDREALAEAFALIPAHLPMIGVVHCAAVLDDGLLAEQTAERFSNVILPKAMGAWNLHELTAHLEIDFFAMFSSIAGTLGSAGQGSYCAGNAFLDALAVHRRAQGLPGSSMAWGPWAESGLAARLGTALQSRLTRRGFPPFAVQQGISLFHEVLERDDAQLLVVLLDVPALSKALGAIPPLWRSLLGSAPTRTPTASAGWVREIAGLPVERRLDAVAQAVCSTVATILSIASSQVPIDHDLQALGLDSLMAVDLRTALGRRAGVTLPATLAFDYPTPRAIAQYLLTQVFALGEARSPSDATGSDGSRTVALLAPERVATVAVLKADASIEDDLCPLEGAPVSEARSVLLTGATGFLGAFLLAELCTSTTAQVTCLVRASSLAAGRQRVVDNLSAYGLWNPAFSDRIAIVLGDLELPLLGLTEARFQSLSEELDAIYSNGVRVSFVAAYERLKASHVTGTRELLRLATRGRPKLLHHVSSTSAYSSSSFRNQTLGESTPPTKCEDMILPYAQCKWVTESMVRSAADRGVPVVVYRPSDISGSSVTGAWSMDDFMLRTIGAMVDLACLPGPFDIHLDFAPVDYVARGIVHLSRQPTSVGRAFNLNHPVGLRWSSLVEMMQTLGYPVSLVPYADWTQRIEDTRHGGLYPLLPFLRARGADQRTYVERMERKYGATVTSHTTASLLEAAGIACPPLNLRLLARYVERLVNIGAVDTDRLPAEPPARHVTQS